MVTYISVIILFIFGLAVNIPMTRKPLSEDDGNWYYPAVFWNKGIRIHKNFVWAYGYFCVHWIATKIYILLNIKNVAFFYYFKIIWYSLTALSIYWLTYCCWHNSILSFTAGLVFAVITAIPNTLFVLTYGEHFFILPINLSIIFTHYGITTGNASFFILAGLMSAWAFQIKPTALLFSVILPVSFCFAPNVFSAVGIYAASFTAFTCLPMLFLRKYTGAHKLYLRGLINPVVMLMRIVFVKLNVRFLNSCIDYLFAWLDIPQGADAYIKNHHNKDLRVQWTSFKSSMRPAIRDLYGVLILAGAQLILLCVEFDPFCFSIIILFIVFLLMQQAQKNYYTPHFNPCWAPISILAAKTVWDMWPYLLNSGALGWAMIVFVGVESIKIGRIIVKSFSKSEINTFGYLGSHVGALLRLPETIGECIQRNSKEHEKLFVWGDHPSIYLYAKREAFDTSYLIFYAYQERILREKELLNSLREKPPELLLFYNYKVNDGWNMDRLQETIGIPYKLLTSFKIFDNKGRTLENLRGIVFDFPLYRRDDKKYNEILLDRALIAKKNGDGDEERKHLENILQMLPKDYEASIWLSLIGNDGDGSGRSRRYLETELSENNDSFKRPILLRLLAEMDVAAGDSNSAMEKYEKALKINSSDFRSYNGLGELYFSQGNTQAAFRSFQKAIELNPYSSDALSNIGVLLAQAGKREDATKCFQKALLFMPSHPDALKNVEALGFRQDSPE
jgi:tetratricopeptide (TPR) repeat protein